MLDRYRDAHFNRIIKATNNLFLQEDSICYNCHPEQRTINCIFCYCPNYDNMDCGGDYLILDNGLKDCSKCLKPHQEEFIKEKLLKLYNSKDI